MNIPTPNPRITTFISSTKDQNNAIKIISDFRMNENATLHWILCKYIECSIIRDETEFINILFNNHHQLVIEMFEWMLMPKIIGKRKKIKSNLDFFPSRCKQFVKDNICFYEKLYLYACNNKLPLTNWFNFLRKQYYDQQTIHTALGYFAEVMVPFAKYQFPVLMNYSIYEAQGYNEIVSIMRIMPPNLIKEIVGFSHYEPVFQFLKTAILVSIEDPADYEICRDTMLNLLLAPQVDHIFDQFLQPHPHRQPLPKAQLTHKIDLLENIGQSFKQLIANIEPNNDVHLRTEYFISVILESKIVPYAVGQIARSRLCNPVGKDKEKQREKEKELSTSVELVYNSPSYDPNPSFNASSLFLSQGKISKKEQIILSDDYQQDQLMQILLKILTYCVQIFIRVPKTVPIPHDHNANPNSNNIDCSISITKVDRSGNYAALVRNFHEQMQLILDSLEKMTKIVYNDPESGIPTHFQSLQFSSGQKIKAISFAKFQYIKLLHNCLIMIQYPENFQAKIQKLNSIRKLKSIAVMPFELKIEKLHIIEIVQKYLSKNRWNNIVHHVLEKICHSLIICSYEYLRKNIEKSLNKKSTQNFLSFLIQNFTQRHYIFLNTFKFTTQGNLQSIYNISKDLAYTLNSTNQLVVLLNEFQPWKKFIMTDLKQYEEKTYPVGTQTAQTQQKQQQSQDIIPGLKVDQVDSIRKLIQNISTTNKWPTKITRNKAFSKSGIIRNSDDKVQQQVQPMWKSNQFYYMNKKKQPLKKTLDDILKKRVEYSIEFQPDHQIQELDVEEISVRVQLSKEKKHNSRNDGHEREGSGKHDKGDAYAVFKSYSAGKN